MLPCAMLAPADRTKGARAPRAIVQGGLLIALTCAAVLAACSDPAATATSGMSATPATSGPVATATAISTATSAISAAPVEPRDERYFTVIRPMLTRRGCDAGPCHGTFKGGGLHLAGGTDSFADQKEVLAQI